jgi:DNA-binding CsgD family transcriptional regulator
MGRAAELAVIAALTEDTTAGFRALVLAGEPGIGKSVLWEAAIADATALGYEILAARTSPSEAPLSYSGLTDLLEDVKDQVLDGLPAPQRASLAIALLRSAEGTADPRALAVGVLGVLRALAAEGPVLIAIDDDQWLDSATAAALQFALRRLRREPVLAVLARRVDPAEPPGDIQALSDTLQAALPAVVRRIDVGPLGFADIRRLITSGSDAVVVSEQQARRLHEMSGGNPFYAAELAAALPRLSESAQMTGELPVPPSLTSLLVRRLDAVSPRTRRAVLITALLASPHGVIVERALADEVGPAAAAALDGAVASRLLVRSGDDRIRLTHPLFGAAARARAEPGEIRQLHSLLARLLTGTEEHARHLALATTPPDLAVAGQLAAAAEHAAQRGSATAAAELNELAWRFTPAGDPLRPARLVSLARRLRWAGSMDSAACLLLEAEIPAMPAGPERAEARYLLAEMSGLSYPGPLYEQALAEASPTIRGYILAQIAGACISRDCDVAQALAWAREADDLTAGHRDPIERSEVVWQLGFIESLTGLDPEHRLAELDAMGPIPGQRLHDTADRLRAVRAIWRGEVASARALLTQLLATSREREEDWSVITFTLHLLELTVRTGDWREAALLADELASLVAPHGRTVGVSCRARAYLAAAHGDQQLAGQLQAEIDAAAQRPASGQSWHQWEVHRAAGLAALFAGDAAGAARILSAVYRDITGAGVREPGAFPVAPDLIEALALAGEPEAAAEILAGLQRAAASQRHPWAQAGTLRASAAIHSARGEDQQAVVDLESAAQQYQELQLPFDHARALLALGAARRRLRQFRQAREALVEAASRLDELGCPPLAARARHELARIGGRRETGGLTPTEEQVAALVAAGGTNRQVAEQLFVSVSAVEAHLTRIYAKLGVANRTQLAGWLASR